MLDLAGINYWAVLVVWVLYMAVGAWWYSTAGFAKQWTKHTGIDILKIPTKQANKIIISVAVSALVQALALAVVLNSLDVTTATNGLLVGLLLWLGFTAATTVGVTLYSKRSWKFLWLNSSYFLVVMAIGAAVLAVWQ
jgi:hypothetical protein